MIVIAGLTACSGAIAPTSTPSPAATPAPTAAVPLAANAFFVAPDGHDANPGTFAQPWATANHAAEVLEAGQTVYLRGGLYPLSRQVRPVNSGREDAWITYRAYPGGQPDAIVKAKGLAQISDNDRLAEVVAQVLADNAGQVATYLLGKEGVYQWLMGQVMRATRGRAAPEVVRQLLNAALEAAREAGASDG